MHNQQTTTVTFAVYRDTQLCTRQTVREQIIKIGSDTRSHLQIDDDRVSRMHAVVEVNSVDDLTLIDLGNQSGTLANGKQINKCRLRQGDVITVGNTRIVVEAIAAAPLSSRSPSAESLLDARIANAKPIDALPSVARRANPFTVVAGGAPFAFSGSSARGDAPEDAPDGSYEYRLAKNAPDVASNEIDTTANDVEIRIRWGRSILDVVHLGARSAFIVGESDDADFALPTSDVAVLRAPLIVREGSALYAVVWAFAKATIELDGEPVDLDEAIQSGRIREGTPSPEGRRIAIEPSIQLTLATGDVRFELQGVRRAKRVGSGLGLASLVGGAAMHVLGSMLFTGGVVAAMSATMPPLGHTGDDDHIGEDQRVLIKQYLVSIAEKERALDERVNPSDAPIGGETGAAGERAKNEEGVMGDHDAPSANKRWGAKGDAPRADVQLASRAALREDAENFGMAGMLASMSGGDPHAPTVPWGGDITVGADPLSGRGNMWGDSIGSSWGVNGLGLTGIGEGGGGNGQGIGITNIGTMNYGNGIGPNAGPGGFGLSGGRPGGGHSTRGPVLRTASTSVTGRIPPEVIQRIVRQNYGRFRACYENALRTQPNLQGRVSVRFVIGRDGRVSNVGAGGDIPDSGVVSCVGRAFHGLSFPQPEGGIVTVSYPIVFTPGA